MSDVPRIVLYGASGHAAAVRDAFCVTPPSLATIVAFIDDFRGDQGESVDGVPVVRFETARRAFADLACFVTIGDPPARRRIVERVAECGGTFFTFSRAGEDGSARVVAGTGCLISRHVSASSSTVLGDHVHVMPLTSLDRDCTIGDFVTLCPSVTIAGCVRVEDEVFVGAGATIVARAGETLTIGRGARIAAGAVITGDVPAGAVRVGNPAVDPRALVTRRLEEAR